MQTAVTVTPNCRPESQACNKAAQPMVPAAQWKISFLPDSAKTGCKFLICRRHWVMLFTILLFFIHQSVYLSFILFLFSIFLSFFNNNIIPRLPSLSFYGSQQTVVSGNRDGFRVNDDHGYGRGLEANQTGTTNLSEKRSETDVSFHSDDLVSDGHSE